MDYYSFLEIPKTSSLKEIKKSISEIEDSLSHLKGKEKKEMKKLIQDMKETLLVTKNRKKYLKSFEDETKVPELSQTEIVPIQDEKEVIYDNSANLTLYNNYDKQFSSFDSKKYSLPDDIQEHIPTNELAPNTFRMYEYSKKYDSSRSGFTESGLFREGKVNGDYRERRFDRFLT
jgi:hypothetical protein